MIQCDPARYHALLWWLVGSDRFSQPLAVRPPKAPVPDLNRRRRKLKQSTVKILYALSGNRCAHPGCQNRLITPETEQSDAAVVNHICHIYARSDGGPRNNPGLNEEERDSYDNLILLCAHHHAIVDKQPESYTAEILKQWKREHEAKLEDRMHSNIIPAAFSAEFIEKDINRLRKRLAFGDSDGIDTALSLARRLIDGDYSTGSDKVIMIGLAWCVRVLLSAGDKLDDADRYLGAAKKIGTCTEIKIASAMALAGKGNKKGALSKLADIDTPASRSAGFTVVARHDGLQCAIEWLDVSKISPAKLDHDGKLLLLSSQLEQGLWEEAFASMDIVDNDDLREAPALHFFMGMTNLMMVVPPDLRNVVFQFLPSNGWQLPLASDKPAMIHLCTAYHHFIHARDTARDLDCAEAAAEAEEYSLWIGLRHPDLKACAQRRLKQILGDDSSRLRFVSLGLQFGIDLDIQAVERQIKQQIALKGGPTYDTAVARFAMVTAQTTPEAVLDHLSRYRCEIADVIDDRALQKIEIEMLALAGRPHEAKERLSELSMDGALDADVDRLQACIEKSEGADPVDIRRQQFERTDGLVDLVQLVDDLGSAKRWPDVCRYGKILFERTKSIDHAERLAFAFHMIDSDERLSTFLESIIDLVERSPRLKLLRCSALYNEGRFVESLKELKKLREESGDSIQDRYYRALQMNILIALGDWKAVTAIVAEEYGRRDERSADELMKLAEVAWCISSPYAKDMVSAAVEKGRNDPAILMRGFHLAATHGWESDEEAGKWWRDAVSLSGTDGPVREIPLKEIMNLNQSWNRRVAETSRRLWSGKIPMFLAAQLTNRSLGSLVLGHAYGNYEERDPRRRSMIPAYSENRRRPVTIDINETSTVAVDGTALFTMSLLNLLDKFIDSFSMVYIAHNTLPWLLQEKQSSMFHQQRLINEAQELQRLLAKRALEIMSPSVVPSSDLCGQLGEELAQMIAEAEKSRDGDETRPLVVRSAPVYRLSSLMEEEADLSKHSKVLVSCGAIVKALRTKGVITATDEKMASEYLGIHERSWPDESEIADRATLYLDDLSISYFLHLGILGKIHTAGHRVLIPQRSVSDANRLVSHQQVLAKMDCAIEHIRDTLHRGIIAGKVSIGKRIVNRDTGDESIARHSTIDVVGLADVCNAIVIDDRFVNRHLNIATSERLESNTPVLTTLDVIDRLFAQGAISADDRLDYRASLRRYGYVSISLDSDELKQHIEMSTVKEGAVLETAELRAIRENILALRMGRWLHDHDGFLWIHSFFKVLKDTLKFLWSGSDKLSSVRARSDWIMNQMDIRGWAHVFDKGDDGGVIARLYAVTVTDLAFSPMTVTVERRDEFHRWLEERVLIPIRDHDRELLSQIVEYYRKLISEAANADLKEIRRSEQ